VTFSESRNDPVNLVDPVARVMNFGGDSVSAELEFRFWKTIRVQRVRTTLAGSAFLWLLNICYSGDDKVVRSIQDANLKGKGR
jgi:hypothetical protein